SESAGAIIRDYLDELLDSLGQGPELDGYEGIRHRLLPMLKSEQWAQGVPGVATAEFAPGLLTCFVIDAPSRIAFVTREMLQKWDMPLERIQEVAQDNLASKEEDVEIMVLRSSDDRVIAMVVSVQDGYDATRLVLPSVRDSFAEELGDEYLVGLPNRDFLVAFSEREPEMAAGIVRQVKHDFQRMNHPLTTTIYRVRPDTIEPADL
ncbi:MAG TPA: DUF1444 family protein, partial [Armatimonadota bacterium]|nr:DUF1444 family protein [Armatimonadota bacterium]